jgi:hypothetical protein
MAAVDEEVANLLFDRGSSQLPADDFRNLLQRIKLVLHKMRKIFAKIRLF